MFYPLAWRVLEEDAAWLPIGTGPATFTMQGAQTNLTAMQHTNLSEAARMGDESADPAAGAPESAG